MNLVKFIFYMGVIHIVFSSLWKFVATVLSSMLKSLGINKDFSFLAFKAIGYYIVVSVSALVTVDMMLSGGPITAGLDALAGTFIVYTTIAGNLERNRWRAVMNYERKRVQVMRYDGYMLIGSLLLYAMTLGMPEIAQNQVVEGFRSFIDQVYRTPIIGWLVGFGAIFYMFYIISRGIKITDELFNSVFFPNRRSAASQASGEYFGGFQGSQAPTDEAEYAEYEEVTDEDQ